MTRVGNLTFANIDPVFRNDSAELMFAAGNCCKESIHGRAHGITAMRSRS